MLSVFIDIIFIASMLLHIKTTQQLRANADLPGKFDYLFSYIAGFAGVMSFSTFTQTFATKPVNGITDFLVGVVGISVCIWSLTIYKEIRWRNGITK